MKPFCFCLLIVLLFSGCTDDSTHSSSDYSNAKKMVVNFAWPHDYGTCFDPKNPEIKISDNPENTDYF